MGEEIDFWLFFFNFKVQIRRIDVMSTYSVWHMDEFIDALLTEESVLDIALPRIPKRWILEGSGTLEPRRSALEDNIDEILEEEETYETAEDEKVFHASRSDTKIRGM